MEQESSLCDKCGKDMANPEGHMAIGVMIGAVPHGEHEQHEYMKRQFGKYDLGKIYNFCYECWLDSLFGVNF